ncbi:MAG: type II secretion system protein GspF, partial [SAR324 cluster bacterium]|nr:type II secretion system protein GspF [SAR324 cluster bacterium]
MPVFKYKALDQKGKNVKGSIDADNLRSARQRLRSQGIYPTDVVEADEKEEKSSRDVKKYFYSNRIGTKDLGIATRQLATLVGAGLPLINA